MTENADLESEDDNLECMEEGIDAQKPYNEKVDLTRVKSTNWPFISKNAN